MASYIIELNLSVDVHRPLAIEVADDFPSLIRIEALFVATRCEAVLSEVTDETSLEILILLWVLENCVQDGLQDSWSHVAVEQAEPVPLNSDPIRYSFDGHLLNIKA